MITVKSVRKAISLAVLCILSFFVFLLLGCKHQEPPKPLPGSENGPLPGLSSPKDMNIKYTYMVKTGGFLSFLELDTFDVLDHPRIDRRHNKTRVKNTIYDAFMPKAKPILKYWGQTVPAMMYMSRGQVRDSMETLKVRMGNPKLVLLEAKYWSGLAFGLTPSNPADTSRAKRDSWNIVFIQQIYDFCYANPEVFSQDTTVWNQYSGQIIIHELGHQHASLTHQEDPRFISWHVHPSKFWCVMHSGFEMNSNGRYLEKSKFCAACLDSIEKEPRK